MPIADFERVLADAQRSDQRALETLYRDLAPLVLGYLRGRGARDPEDLTSETFVAMMRNLHRFRGNETRLRTWVLTIAHRRLIDDRRRLSRRPESPMDPTSMAETRGTTASDAGTAALANLGGQEMVKLLDELTDDQRAVVVLRIVADLPVNDVARILKKRPGAVKTMQRRALATLARALDGAPALDGRHAAGPGNSPEGDEPPVIPAQNPDSSTGEFPSPVVER